MPSIPKDRPYSIRCLSAIEGLQGGRLNLSKHLGVTTQTIAFWFMKKKIPSRVVLPLVLLANGKFSAEELMGLFDKEGKK